MSLEFDLYPRADPVGGTKLVTFAHLQQGEVRKEYQGTGSGRFVLRGDIAEAQFIDPKGLQYVRVRDTAVSATVPVAGFFTDHGDFEALTVKRTRKLTFGGAGALSILARCVMDEQTYLDSEGGKDPTESGQDVWNLHLQGSWIGAVPHALGSFLHRVMREATHADRPRQPLDGVTWDFDASTDSNGNPWTPYEGEFTAQIGESVLSVVQRLMQLGLIVEMDAHTFELHAYNPANPPGVDKSGGAWGAGVVRFQTASADTVATGNIKSEAKRGIQALVKRSHLLVGSELTYVWRDEPSADIVWEGSYRILPGDTAALNAAADAQLAARTDAGDTARLRISYGNSVGTGRYRPITHFTTGDTATLHSGTGAMDWDESDKIISAITWQKRRGGPTPDVFVDFGSTYRAFDDREFQVATGAGCQCIRLCGEGSANATIITVAGTDDLEFGYLDPDTNVQTSLWRRSVDGTSTPIVLTAAIPLVTALTYYIRDYTVPGVKRDYDPSAGDYTACLKTNQGDGTVLYEWDDLNAGLNPNDLHVLIPVSTEAGVSPQAARCDHSHHHNDLLSRDAPEAHPASASSYDNTASGLTADDVQEAIDELATVSGSSALDWFIVTDPLYGAVGDDTTDDTAAIQAAIDAAEPVHGTVYFPALTYKITAELVVDNAIRLLGSQVGQGEGSTIHQATNNTDAISFTTNAYRSSMSNLQVFGPVTHASGVGIETVRNIVLEDVWVQDFGTGIKLGTSSFYSKLERVGVYNCTTGIDLVDGSNNTDISDPQITTCTTGIYVRGCEKVRISGGSVEGCVTYGVRVDSATNDTSGVTVAGVYFENASGCTDIAVGVVNDTVKGVILSGNKFTDGVTRHIDVQYASGVVIQGNHFRDTGSTVRTQDPAADVFLIGNVNDGTYTLNATTYTLPAAAGAPTTADYLVGTAQGGLSAEIVVGATPGGELGGTWASPTVDATHSGSTHSAATDTHIADASDAHDASAISFTPNGSIAATDVQAAIQEVRDEAGAGSGGYAEGTSFPGGPATDDKFYRTDRNLLYFYDGTRWLTVTLYEHALTDFRGILATSSEVFTPVWAILYDCWLETMVATMNAASGLSGTAYWTIEMYSYDGATGSGVLATVNDMSGTNGAHERKSVAINALLGTGADALSCRAVKTSIPGAFNGGAMVLYRLVG